MKRLSLLAFPLSAFVTLSSCKTATSSSEGAGLESISNSNPNAPITVKLYDSPQARPSADCDVFTEMVLKPTSATLTNKLIGGCEILVTPNPRTYALTAEDDGCGSMVYTGRRGNSEITITDNTLRTCENVVAAVFVVEETTGGNTEQFYSIDRPSTPPSTPSRPAENSDSFVARGYLNVDLRERTWFIGVDSTTRELSILRLYDSFSPAERNIMMDCMSKRQTHAVHIDVSPDTQVVPTDIPGQNTTTHLQKLKNVRCASDAGFIDIWRAAVRNSRFR